MAKGMEIYDFLEYGCWLLYLVVGYAIMTLLHKSFNRAKIFANINYMQNCSKFHRCYGPELCCHTLKGEGEFLEGSGCGADTPARQTKVSDAIKCQINKGASQKQQQQSKVNKIAQMFESGNAAAKRLPYNHKGRRAPHRALNLQNNLFLDRFKPKPGVINLSKQPELLQTGDACYEHEEHSNLCGLFGNLTQYDLLPTAHCTNGTTPPLPPDVYRRYSQTKTHTTKKMTHNLVMPDVVTLNDLSTIIEQKTGESHATPPTSSRLATPPNSPVLLRSHALNLHTSVEDIFETIAANAEQEFSDTVFGKHSTTSDQMKYYANSIDDILSERRLSRPLSAYSITELCQQNEPTPPL